MSKYFYIVSINILGKPETPATIGLSYVEDKDIYIDNTPNQTARTYATLVIEPKIEKDKQKN